MSTILQQAQSEGLCLRYPENLGLHRELTWMTACDSLLRAVQMAQTVPFAWGYVDKPPEGQLLLLFLPLNAPFPIDGIRFQDNEVKYIMPAGPLRELEVHEVKFGFIPNSQDTHAWRLRRRYRLIKGGHPQLFLVHYTRGQQTHIAPALMNQPLRAYPLRNINEPAMFVAGDKAGQKVFPPGTPMHNGPPTAVPQSAMGIGMNFNSPQAMLAQQNANMDTLERRRERERERARDRSGSTAGRPHQDDDSGDEIDQISTRTLAMTRYKRNHDLMNEVFAFAAFGDKKAPLPTPYSIFSQSDLEGNITKLQAEVADLESWAAQRKVKRNLSVPLPDMEVLGEELSL